MCCMNVSNVCDILGGLSCHSTLPSRALYSVARSTGHLLNHWEHAVLHRLREFLSCVSAVRLCPALHYSVPKPAVVSFVNRCSFSWRRRLISLTSSISLSGSCSFAARSQRCIQYSLRSPFKCRPPDRCGTLLNSMGVPLKVCSTADRWFTKDESAFLSLSFLSFYEMR